MKNYFFPCLVFYALYCMPCNAQSKRDKIWVIGSGISYKVIFEQGGIVNKFLDTISSPYFSKGNSNICDTNGNLILCSDGYNLYDSNVNFIDGGDTLIPKDFYVHEDGWSLYSQSGIFLPIDSNKYYFITPTFSDIKFADCLANNNCYFDLLLYNVIDMNANGGAGKVVKRMQPLMENANLRKTQMMACRHANGKDWWLLKQAGDSNTIYKFLFTQDSVYNMGIDEFDNPVWGIWDTKGQSVFTPDGRKYATISEGDTVHGAIFIADFDRCYGILSNTKVIQAPIISGHYPMDTTLLDKNFTGLAFSPDGSKLYAISQYNIFQYDLIDGTWYHVVGLDTSWQKFQLYSNAYLGADNKLYIGNFGGLSKQMSVINSPDVKGAGCNFCPRCLRLDSVFWAGGVTTPPCMPNYSLGTDTCWALGGNEHLVVTNDIEVFPNPSSTVLYIKSKSNSKRELYNSIGQLLFTTNENEIDVSKYSKGMYYIKVANEVRKVIIE